MSDLISRDALVKCMSERWRTLVALNGEYDHYTAGFDDAISYVDDAPSVDAVPVVRCRECVFFQERHVRTEDGQMKSYDEFPPEAFGLLGTGDVTSDYGINVGSQCLVDCNRGYGEDKTVFRQPDDYCSRGVRKMGAKMDGGSDEKD